MAICLWFDGQAEQAADFYLSIFENASIGRISRYGQEGFEFHKKPVGTAMTVEFTLNGMNFIGLNGGPQFRFNEAVSVVVYCETQDEIDYYWNHLTNDGEEGPCGWLKDQFGVSWQVIPGILSKVMADPNKAGKAAKAFMQMRKFDIEKIVQATMA